MTTDSPTLLRPRPMYFFLMFDLDSRGPPHFLVTTLLRLVFDLFRSGKMRRLNNRGSLREIIIPYFPSVSDRLDFPLSVSGSNSERLVMCGRQTSTLYYFRIIGHTFYFSFGWLVVVCRKIKNEESKVYT